MRTVDLDDYDSLGKLKAWLEPWFHGRFLSRGDIGPIDSTENVGLPWGVQSVEPDGGFEPARYVLAADGAGGSTWAENTIGAAFQALVLAEPTLWAYWPLTEASGNALDEGPSGYDLTAEGSGIEQGVAGPFPPQTAYDFHNTAAVSRTINGADANTLLGNLSAFTFECIAYMPSIADANDALILIDIVGIGDFGLYVTSALGTNGASFIRGVVNTGAVGFPATFYDLPATRWTHLAGTYDGSNMRLYADGDLITTKANTANLGTLASTTKIWIGRIGSSPEYTKARISNVAIYSSALDAATIASHAAVFARGGEGGSLAIDHGGLYGLGDDDHPQYVLRSIATTAGDLIVAGASAVLARLGIGSNNQALIVDTAQPLKMKWAAITESVLSLSDVTTLDSSTSKHGFLKKLSNTATEFMDGTGAWDSVKDSDLSTSDITTNDVTTSKHGFVPKAPNDTAKFLRGDGSWNVPTLPSGSAAIATDAIWDAKGDSVWGTGADAATKLSAGSNGQVVVFDSAQTPGVKVAYPPGYEFGYTEITSGVTITSTTETSGTAVVSSGAITYPAIPIVIEFFAPLIGITAATDTLILTLWDSTTMIGRLARLESAAGTTTLRVPCYAAYRLTPSAASHTYRVEGYKAASGGGTFTVFAGAAGGAGNNLPAFIRVTAV